MAIKVGGTTVIDDSRDVSNIGSINSRSSANIAYMWANVNGQNTAALRDSDNVSSIGDYGTGRYTFNLTSAFGTIGYSLSANSTWNGGSSAVSNTNINGDTSDVPTTSSFKSMSFETNTSTTFDPLHVYVSAHGNS